MKVAMLVPGGVDRSGEYRVIPCLLWLIERLARLVQLHVFALAQEPRPATYALLGATVHNVGGSFRRARAILAVLGEHRRAPFDALHAVWVDQGVVAAALGGLLRRPVLLHITGGDLAALPEIGYGLLLSWRGRLKLQMAARAASLITVPSNAMRDAATGLGLATLRLPYGVALDRWPVAAPSPRAARGPARLLHVGSLNRVKDQSTLLRAVRVLTSQGVPFSLDVVGEDTLGGEVQREAASLGLQDRVVFHGFLPHRALRPLVERAHLLVVTSRHEADPVVLLEAAVAGVPTVGTAVGHIRDWAPEAAVAVPVGDAESLAQGIAGLLTDEERRCRLAQAAQGRAVREDADWTARQVLGGYERAVRLRGWNEQPAGG